MIPQKGWVGGKNARGAWGDFPPTSEALLAKRASLRWHSACHKARLAFTAHFNAQCRVGGQKHGGCGGAHPHRHQASVARAVAAVTSASAPPGANADGAP